MFGNKLGFVESDILDAKFAFVISVAFAIVVGGAVLSKSGSGSVDSGVYLEFENGPPEVNGTANLSLEVVVAENYTPPERVAIMYNSEEIEIVSGSRVYGYSPGDGEIFEREIKIRVKDNGSYRLNAVPLYGPTPLLGQERPDEIPSDRLDFKVNRS